MRKIYFVLMILLIFIIGCSSPKQLFRPKSNDKIFTNNTNNEISLLTYNVQTVFGKSDPKVTGLINYLNEEKFDFVTMQEVFNEGIRKDLIKSLDSNFYKSIIPRIDYSSFPSLISQDAGLFSVSQFPQIDLSKYNFGKKTKFSHGAIHQLLNKEISISMDFLANKSIMGSLYEINDSTKLFLFTTHLQALSSDFQKTLQLNQIYSFIVNSTLTVLKNKLVDSPENLIVILTGDLNQDAYDQEKVDILKKYLGNPRDLHKEFNSEAKEYTMTIKLIGVQKRLDYIFAYDNLESIPLRKVKINSINVTDVVDKENNSISDHYAIKAVLKIK